MLPGLSARNCPSCCVKEGNSFCVSWFIPFKTLAGGMWSMIEAFSFLAKNMKFKIKMQNNWSGQHLRKDFYTIWLPTINVFNLIMIRHVLQCPLFVSLRNTLACAVFLNNFSCLGSGLKSSQKCFLDGLSKTSAGLSQLNTFEKSLLI